MERRIKTSVPLSEIVFDRELYPRATVFWQTSFEYSQEMKAGAKFPPIVLALHKGKKILIDGKHRFEAHKLLKLEKIEAEIYTGWNRKKMFEESILRNISHGKALSPYEKRTIALKLRNMKYNFNQISKIIQVPMDKLETFIAQRLVNSITGETIKEVVVKSELKHLAGKEYSPKQMQVIEEAQDSMHQQSQLNLLNSLISLIENGLLNTDDEKISERFEYLKHLIT